MKNSKCLEEVVPAMKKTLNPKGEVTEMKKTLNPKGEDVPNPPDWVGGAKPKLKDGIPRSGLL